VKPARKLEKILYVEDDPDIRTVATLALEAVGGFVLRVCASGNEAIEAAPGFRPDLLLIDVMMPGLDGPSTLAALRELPETASTPAVFMTAKVQPSEVARYREIGVADVIAKPFDPMTLADAVREAYAKVF
jgi:CheY-like chemotaxis protein